MTTIASDLKPASGVGYDFVADDETVTVQTGVIVRSLDASGIASSRTGSFLVNHGTVESDVNNAVSLVNQGAGVTNAVDGLLAGATGIFLDNWPGEITNHGTIHGFLHYGVLVALANGQSTITNDGWIYGQQAGINAFQEGTSTTPKHTYANHGSIGSAEFGIRVAGNKDVEVSIVNFSDGKVSGGLAAIATQQFGHVVVDNRGLLDGGIVCTTTGRDKVTNSGRIVGDVHLGDGNDRFNGAGGTSARVFGDAGDDALSGGAKGDRLNGGDDADTLFGGGGKDVFDFDNIFDSRPGSPRDLIKDFHHSQHDRIDLHGIDAKAGPGGNQDFAFRGTAAFTKAGQVRIVLHDEKGSADDTTTVLVNVNGDSGADMKIELKGLIHLQAGDFVL